MNDLQKCICVFALSWTCAGVANGATQPSPEYPPQKIKIEDLVKGLVGVLAKGLEGAQRNKAANKLDLKSCYDSGHANGSLFYATQVPGFDWKDLENKVNQKLSGKKLRVYKDYGEMIAELISDWQKCSM
jgi:hypothetical protein